MTRGESLTPLSTESDKSSGGKDVKEFAHIIGRRVSDLEAKHGPMDDWAMIINTCQ